MRKKSAILAFFLACLFVFAGAISTYADEQYTVQDGDSLWMIANQFGITVDELEEWNGLPDESLQIGQIILIKTFSGTVSENTEIMYYTIHEGDTLDTLSDIYGTKPATIISDNDLFSENVEVGQILKLRVPAGTIERESSSISEEITYYDEEEDMLSSIAQTFSMIDEELENINGLSSDFDTIYEEELLTFNETISNVSRGSIYRTIQEVNSSAVILLLDYAQQLLGTPYCYGGSNPDEGFDCSGFVQYVYQNALGIPLERTAAGQATQGTEVSQNDLIPGDILYFASGGYIDHVGIYIGSGQFIHSSSPSSGGVIISSLSQSYYSSHYEGARRIL